MAPTDRYKRLVERIDGRLQIIEERTKEIPQMRKDITSLQIKVATTSAIVALIVSFCFLSLEFFIK